MINAMLKDKILPSGIGHTTHCFLQVEGMETAEPCVLLENDPTPRSIQVSNILNPFLVNSFTIKIHTGDV